MYKAVVCEHCKVKELRELVIGCFLSIPSAVPNHVLCRSNLEYLVADHSKRRYEYLSNLDFIFLTSRLLSSHSSCKACWPMTGQWISGRRHKRDRKKCQLPGLCGYRKKVDHLQDVYEHHSDIDSQCMRKSEYGSVLIIVRDQYCGIDSPEPGRTKSFL